MTYKVVLIDDETLILRSLTKIIDWQAFDCKVVGTANDGVEGISLIEEAKPEIVITDINMPEKNGLDLLREVQLLSHRPEVILLSGYNEFEYAREGLQNNAFDYILKPIDHEELEECLGKVIVKFKEDKKKHYEQRKYLIYEALTLGYDNEVTVNDQNKHAIATIELNKPSIIFEERLLDLVQKERGEDPTEIFFYKFESTRYVMVYTHPNRDVDLTSKVKGEIIELKETIDSLVKIALGKEVIGLQNLSTSFQETFKLLESASFLKMNLVSEQDIKKEYRSKYSPEAAMEKAKRYMQENFTKEIGIEAVCEEVLLSVSYFSVLFKEKTGVTFLEYLTKLRIEHACVLLKTTDLKTYEIANMVGYSDQRYFSQVFKKRLQMTPSQYRSKE
ncbi:response regulator transcription factor [Halalkalibacter okhensis]|uniref:AraC family transcriptional regulator n=1 Tax=Halalkalibacter okhensis TaxID=333138 RepID=A0A0B0IL03_9BACI|nr:response regulator [Halalkalibacter okhensis]KHF41572.1 hypothetical protein LQ50_02360 [Halalkalibacter okhensis]